MTQTTKPAGDIAEPTLPNARQILIAVMREVEGVAKRDRNSAQGFNFRGIDAVVNAVGPALRKHGGFIIPTVINADHEVATTAKGSQVNVVRLDVEYAIYGQAGAPLRGVVSAEAMDSGDKATAKAMSVAYRTFLLQALCLPTDEPDPDHDSFEATPRDWIGEADSAPSKAALRAVWAEANKARVPKAMLDKIAALADGKPE